MKLKSGLIAAVAVAAGAQGLGMQARLVHLSAAQAGTAAQKIVAATTSDKEPTPDTESGQNFVLRAPGAEDLILMPGELQVNPPAKSTETQMQCGLFLLNRNGKAQYLPVVGPDYKPYSWCERLDGIGLSADLALRPSLILVFLLRAAGGNHYHMPFVLTWDAGSSGYKVDYATSFQLAKLPNGDTVAGARRPLATRK